MSNFEFPALLVQTESELLFICIGLALCLGGWIIFRLGTRLLGVALGAGFGFFFGEVLGVLLETDRNTTLFIVMGCSLIGAIAALFFIRAVTNFLFALIGFLFGALLGRLGAEFIAAWQQTEFILTPGAGIGILAAAGVTALLAVWLQRLIMILITSYMGATFLVPGIEYLDGKPWAFPAILLAAIIWQMWVLGRILRGRRLRPPARREEREQR